ncbi:hypothetical protein [Aliikangiella sp. G2MR2-5]|uniref:hypothetical protein n=1 Tax=Aliikangiella sp. G2MR2-5 TaxID=2788943 RepID=UPI0018AA0F2D|nr:hypothetical protein [Aliikangiella sp. G2MR2-5]
MSISNHQWQYFYKGKMKVKACINCGNINFAAAQNTDCEKKDLSESLLVKAGYQTEPLSKAS